jgi:hypothetical protein
MSLQDFKRVVKEQFFMLRLDEAAALAALPAMLPSDPEAQGKALAAVREVIEAVGAMGKDVQARLARIEAIFTAGADTSPEAGEPRPGRAARASSLRSIS